MRAHPRHQAEADDHREHPAEQHAQGYGARLTGDQGSAILRSMVLADGLAVVPPDTTIAPGEAVDVIVLRSLERRTR